MRCLPIFALLLAIVAACHADPATNATRTVYRIRVEEGVSTGDVVLSPKDREAIARLESAIANWPTRLWLISDAGKLRAIKLGPDGKPETR
jgi:hypothetical protein